MQVIGNLVCVCADERTFHLVNRTVELVQGDIVELRGEDALQLRIEAPPEPAAPPDDILPQPRLTFMDTGGRAACKRRAFQFHADALFIKRVPGFVQSREERIADIVLPGTRGDTHIPQGELRHERMVRLIASATLELIAEPLCDIHAELKLLILREILAQTRIIGRRLFGNRAGNWDQFFPQIRKNTADIGSLHPVIPRFNQRIGDVFIARKEIGGLAAIRQRFLQIGTHPFKIVRRTRRCPSLIGGGGVVCHFCHKFWRDFGGARIFSPSDAQQTRLIGIVIKTLFVRHQLV